MYTCPGMTLLPDLWLSGVPLYPWRSQYLLVLYIFGPKYVWCQVARLFFSSLLMVPVRMHILKVLTLGAVHQANSLIKGLVSQDCVIMHVPAPVTHISVTDPLHKILQAWHQIKKKLPTPKFDVTKYSYKFGISNIT